MKNNTYSFSEFLVKFNGATYTVAGTGKFIIEPAEDLSYLGDYYATFTNVSLDDIVFESSEEFGRNILSEQDTLLLEKEVQDSLNEDLETCFGIADIAIQMNKNG